MNNYNNHTNTMPQPEVAAYLGIGANLGDRAASIQTALQKIGDWPGIEVTRISSLYETAAIGMTDQPDFLNLVAALRTTLPPRALLGAFLHIENQMGRTRTVRWGPRVIDLDLLLYGEAQVLLPGLTVPHPGLRERAFVVVPLAEIAPDLVLPGDGKKVLELADTLRKTGNIQRFPVV